MSETFEVSSEKRYYSQSNLNITTLDYSGFKKAIQLKDSGQRLHDIDGAEDVQGHWASHDDGMQTIPCW